jgi:hypothetical protein
VTVKAPDEGRRAISCTTSEQAPTLAVTATAGLRGVPQELARRIRARGTDRLEEEIAALLAQAPVRRSERPSRSQFLPAEA